MSPQILQWLGVAGAALFAVTIWFMCFRADQYSKAQLRGGAIAFVGLPIFLTLARLSDAPQKQIVMAIAIIGLGGCMSLLVEVRRRV